MLVRMVSISWPCDPPTSASQSAGIIGVSHRARPKKDYFLCHRLWVMPMHLHFNLFMFPQYITISASYSFLKLHTDYITYRFHFNFTKGILK